MGFHHWQLVEIRYLGERPFMDAYEELIEAYKKAMAQVNIGSVRLARFVGFARIAAANADDEEFEDFVDIIADELENLDTDWAFYGVNCVGDVWWFSLA